MSHAESSIAPRHLQNTTPRSDGNATELRVRWTHPHVWGSISSAFLLLFGCAAVTTGMMDLTNGGWLLHMVFILSVAFCAPFAVLTGGAAYDLWKARQKGEDSEDSVIGEVPAH